MKRYEMIKNQDYFGSIIKSGKYIKNNLFVIYYVSNDSNKYPHFGIAIKNSIGKANIRVKLKRQVRSIIDINKNLFQKDKDYIIMIRNECLNSNFQDMKMGFESLMKGKFDEKK